MVTRAFRLSTLGRRLAACFGVATLLLSSTSALTPALVSADATSQDIAKVSFTFDDGLSSALLAAQALQPYGYAGTDYIITHCIGMKVALGNDTCAADATKDYMTWADVHTLQDTYHWEIGSHTQTHPLTAAVDNPTLTDQQLDQELGGSQADLTAQGFTATDFASPYGDYDNRSIAVEAKYYASHRTFQDPSYSTAAGSDVATATAGTATFPYYSPVSGYPYNNYLLTTLEVQGDVSVKAVESAIDQAVTNHQWLILVFHNIMASGASTAKDDYQYNAADLGAIAAYVQSKNVPVVNVKEGLPSGSNIMTDSGFNNAIGTCTTGVTGTCATPASYTGWVTDSSTTIKNDTQTTTLAGHGSYDGTASGALNSIAIASSTAQTHLFSPRVTVTPGATYTLTNFVNVTSTAGGINFYVDEYDAAGNYINFVKAVGPVGSTNAQNVQVGDVNFKYTPSTATVAYARVYADIAPSTTGYIDNMQWLAPNGTVVTPPTSKPGDVNGDGAVNIKDATLVSLNWGKTGVTAAQGDLNGDGTVNIKDATLVSLNWGK